MLECARRRTTNLRFVLLAGLLAASGLVFAACNGGSDSGSADVTIDSVTPESPYPGVETTVEFSIEPGANVSADDLSWRVEFGDDSSQTGDGTEGSVTHEWENSGQFTVQVVALAGDSTVGSANQSVRVLEPVDLSVSGAEPQTPNVEAGEEVTVNFDVENRSPAPFEQSAVVEVYLSTESDVSPEDFGDVTKLGETTLESSDGPTIEPSGTATGQLTGTVPEEADTGDYYVVPWVNPDHADAPFSDPEPDNNYTASSTILRVQNPSSFLPDITVEDVYVVPDRAYPALNQFQRGFTLANEGGVEAPGVVTETYLSVGDDSFDPEQDRKISESDPQDVGGGEEIEVGPDQFTLDDDITPGSDGEKEVYVFVRARITESDEEMNTDNNVGVSDPPITVSDQLADGPDIAVEEFSVSPQSTFLDGSLQASMTVANRGTADVGSFICGLYLGEEARVARDDDPRFASLNVASLDSDESREITRTVTVPGVYDPGTYYVYTYCDPNGVYDETFRSNNQKIHPESVEITDRSDVDLYVDQLDVPGTVQEGNETGVTATICVSGSNASGETQGALYRTAGTTVDYEADPYQTFSIPNISPDSCKDVDIEFTASCRDFEEEYAFGVEVDTQDELPENDEENNTKSGTNPMTVEGEFCSCNPDQFEPNGNASEAVPLTDGSYSASICTPGSDDYFAVDLEQGDSLVVTVEYDAEKGPLETELFNPFGGQPDVLDADDAADFQQVAVYGAPQNQRYTFAVRGADSSSRNLYDMEVEVVSQSDGIDLAPEEVEFPGKSDEDTFSIGEQVEMNTTVHNIGTTASGDFDVEWYLTPDRELGDGDDVAMTPQQVRVQSIDGGTTDNERDVSANVELPTNVSDGTYYVAAKAKLSSGVTDVNLDNNGNFSRAIDLQTRCYDELEPNDRRSTATSVEANASYSNLLACASEDDFYELCVQDGKKFSVSTDFNSNEGDIDMELYDRNGNLVDSSAETNADSEEVSVDYVNGDQCYTVRTFLLSSEDQVETNYSMSTNVEDVDPSLRCASHFEPNNAFDSASSFISAVQMSDLLDRCPSSDTDYYRLSLSQGQVVTLRGILDPNAQSGTLRLQLYKPNRQPAVNASTAPTIPEAEITDYQAPVDGTYFLQVTISGSTRKTTYRLEEEGLGGIDLTADDLSVWQGQFAPGSSARFDFDLGNQRSDTASGVSYTVYLGDAQTLDEANDTELGQFSYGDVQGNTTTTVANSVTLPSDASSGKHYLHVKVEPGSGDTDPNPSNNVATSTIYFQ